VIRHRLWCALAVMAWALAGLAETAWAHPEPMSVGAVTVVGPAIVGPVSSSLPAERASAPRTPAADPAVTPRSAPLAMPHHAPPAIALAVGGMALLAMIPRRRRTMALLVTGLLLALSLEGASHAILHLGHVGHADTLIVGVSPLPPAADEPATGSGRAVALAPIGAAPDTSTPPALGCAVPSLQGRSPPSLLAS